MAPQGLESLHFAPLRLEIWLGEREFSQIEDFWIRLTVTNFASSWHHRNLADQVILVFQTKFHVFYSNQHCKVLPCQESHCSPIVGTGLPIQLLKSKIDCCTCTVVPLYQSCSTVLTYLHSYHFPAFVVLFLSGGKRQVALCFSFVVFGWSNYFILLVCVNWVCKAICPLESSIWSPARGSHSFEWIKPGQSTSFGSVGQLSVCMLKSCIHKQVARLLTVQLTNVTCSITVPCLSKRKQSLWMKCICSRMAQTNSPSFTEKSQQTI